MYKVVATQASAYEFQVYLTNTGCQVISMAQFVQTHDGGKALLYKGYKYLKIPDGKECAHFGDARGTRANAQQEGPPMNLYRERRKCLPRMP